MRQKHFDMNYSLLPTPYSLFPIAYSLFPALSTGGEVANAQVCKTCIRGFNPRPVLQVSVAAY